MRTMFILLTLTYSAFALPEGEVLFKNHCMRCHTQESPKPLSFLKKKYADKPHEVMELAKRCPWGKGLSDMEIEIIARWLAGKE